MEECGGGEKDGRIAECTDGGMERCKDESKKG